MGKEVVITADSTCDLPAYVLKKHNIEIAALSVLLGEENYKDGINITPDDIYSYYKKTKVLPKTAAVSLGEYYDLFEKHTSQGKAVVHLSLSSAISSSHQNAKITASQFDDVYVIDSKNLCTALGLLVLKACDWRDEGLPADQIAEKIEAIKHKVKANFVLDTLEFLHKGGRCSGIARLGSNVLGIKPTIEVNTETGTMQVGKKYRGKIDTVYKQYVSDRLAHVEKIDKQRIVVAHSGIPQVKIDSFCQMVSTAAMFGDIIVARAGCTITSHCGPGTLAVFYIEK